jgi:5-methylcytosine-specific restriction endonuclease McrA
MENTIPSKNARRRVTKRFLTTIRMINHDSLHCVYCEVELRRLRKKKSWKNGLTVDHFVPVSKGGMNASENLFLCCLKCNKEKDNLNPETDLTFWTEFLPSKIGIILC